MILVYNSLSLAENALMKLRKLLFSNHFAFILNYSKRNMLHISTASYKQVLIYIFIRVLLKIILIGMQLILLLFYVNSLYNSFKVQPAARHSAKSRTNMPKFRRRVDQILSADGIANTKSDSRYIGKHNR